MDRVAIRNLIQAAGYGADVPSVLAQDLAISAVLIDISQERDWSWLRATDGTKTLTVGSAVVPLPTDIDIPIALRISFGGVGFEPVEQSEGAEVQRLLHLIQDVGQPTRWNWFEGGVWVEPRADKAYDVDLDYIKTPVIDSVTPFTDTEAMPFTLRFHTVVAWGAIRYLAFRQGDQAKYAIANAEFTAAKLKMERRDRSPAQSVVQHWPGWQPIE